MSADEISIKSVAPPQFGRTPAAPQAGQAFAELTKVAETVKTSKATNSEIQQMAANRKGESVDELSQMSERLNAAMEKLNAAVRKASTSLNFSRDESSKRFVVQVTDIDTGEIIRNLPGEAVLRMSSQLDSLKGVLFDDLF